MKLFKNIFRCFLSVSYKISNSKAKRNLIQIKIFLNDLNFIFALSIKKFLIFPIININKNKICERVFRLKFKS